VDLLLGEVWPAAVARSAEQTASVSPHEWRGTSLLDLTSPLASLATDRARSRRSADSADELPDGFRRLAASFSRTAGDMITPSSRPRALITGWVSRRLEQAAERLVSSRSFHPDSASAHIGELAAALTVVDARARSWPPLIAP